MNSFIYDLKNKTNEHNLYNNTACNEIDMINLKYPEFYMIN
jgi:hypothetical protein